MTADTRGPGIPALRVDTAAGDGGDAPRRAAVVVSDGSALRVGDRSLAMEGLARLLEDDAAGIHIRTGVPVQARPMAARDAEDLTAQLLDLPADSAVIFLTHTDPDRARATRSAVHQASPRAVLTDADATAISLTAGLLTAIAHTGRTPATSQVVIAGSARMPELCPLLMAVGVGDISSWNASDAHAFPLHHLARHATAMIDLLGATALPGGWAPGDHRSAVLSPTDPTYRLLPTLGLIAALVRHRDARPDINMFRSCALSLAAVTPPGRLVPDVNDPHLADTVASAVARTVGHRASSSHQGPPHTAR